MMLSINDLHTTIRFCFDKGCFLPMLGVMTPLNPIQNPIQSMTYTQAVKECFLDFLKDTSMMLLGFAGLFLFLAFCNCVVLVLINLVYEAYEFVNANF